MDTMNWAGQVCEEMLRQMLPALTLCVWLGTISLICWAGASLARRAQ